MFFVFVLTHQYTRNQPQGRKERRESINKNLCTHLAHSAFSAVRYRFIVKLRRCYRKDISTLSVMMLNKVETKMVLPTSLASLSNSVASITAITAVGIEA
jgi:hypothetical protein